MTTPAPRFTIVMQIGRSLELLPYSVASVLAQTDQSFELFMVCDPEEPNSVRAARELAAADSRLRLFEHPRGNPAGPTRRATTLAHARGTLVAELTDEALWFPDHLGELNSLLAEVDFGNLLHAELDPDGSVYLHPGDLNDPAARERMLASRWSGFAASCAGYRLDAYRRLPDADSEDSAALDLTPDHALWGRFASTAGVLVGTRFAVQGVTLRAAYRTASVEARATEGAAVYTLVSDARGRSDLRHGALASWQADAAATQAAVDVAAAEVYYLYRSRAEISAQLAEYAHSRAALALENGGLRAGASELQGQIDRLTEQVSLLSAQVGQLSAQVRRLRVRVGRLRTRVTQLSAGKRRLHHRLNAIEGSTAWRIVHRTARLRAAATTRVRRH